MYNVWNIHREGIYITVGEPEWAHLTPSTPFKQPHPMPHTSVPDMYDCLVLALLVLHLDEIWKVLCTYSNILNKMCI